AAPERALGQEPNCPIMVVVDVGEVVGQFFVRSLVRLACEVARDLPYDGSVERRRLGTGGRQKARDPPGDQPERGSSEEIPASHETTSRLLTATLGNAVHAWRFLPSEQNCQFFPMPK